MASRGLIRHDPSTPCSASTLCGGARLILVWASGSLSSCARRRGFSPVHSLSAFLVLGFLPGGGVVARVTLPASRNTTYSRIEGFRFDRLGRLEGRLRRSGMLFRPICAAV